MEMHLPYLCSTVLSSPLGSRQWPLAIALGRLGTGRILLGRRLRRTGKHRSTGDSRVNVVLVAGASVRLHMRRLRRWRLRRTGLGMGQVLLGC